MFQKGTHLLSLDIQNAFNSLSWEAIAMNLRRTDVAENIIQYIMNMLQMRFSKDTDQLHCGVPQGDSLSMYLFCICIDPIMTEIQKKYPGVGFADDGVLKIIDLQ